MKILLCCLLLFLITLFIESKKKKKKKTTKIYPDNPKDRRPEKVKPELYCDACQAMVKEAIKALYGKKKETDVVDILSDVCNPEKYYVYCKNYC